MSYDEHGEGGGNFPQTESSVFVGVHSKLSTDLTAVLFSGLAKLEKEVLDQSEY